LPLGPGLRGWVDARPYPLCGHRLDGKPIERIAKGFHAGWCSTSATTSTAFLYPQRIKDLTKLIFESEIKHWDEPDEG